MDIHDDVIVLSNEGDDTSDDFEIVSEDTSDEDTRQVKKLKLFTNGINFNLQQQQLTNDFKTSMCRIAPVIVFDSDDDLPDLELPQVPSLLPASPIVISSTDDESIQQNYNNSAKYVSPTEPNKCTNQEMLITKSTKERLFSLFNKVVENNKNKIRLKTSTVLSPGPPINSQSTACKRHFLDAFTLSNDDGSPDRSVVSRSDTTFESSSINSSFVFLNDYHVEGKPLPNNDSIQDNNNEEVFINTKMLNVAPETHLPSNRNQSLKRPRKARKLNHQISKSSLKKYFQPVLGLSEHVNQEGRYTNHVSYETKIVCEVESLTRCLSQLQVSTIRATMEGGDEFLEYGLTLLHDYCAIKQPTEDVIKNIIDQCMLGCAKKNVWYKCFNVLNFILEKHPLYKTTCCWYTLSLVIPCILGLSNEPNISIPQGSLFLHNFVQTLERDLFKRDLCKFSEIRTSQCYKLLSIDKAFSNLSQVIRWLQHAITTDFCTSMDVKEHMLNTYISKAVPNLQRLIYLGIQVSHNCLDASKCVVSELVHTYLYLSDIVKKKQLINTMVSDLLRFKMTQKIIEDHCHGAILCCADFPTSLRQVVDSYRRACPPCIHDTPPQSPTYQSENVAIQLSQQQYSASSCEELVFLVYINTQSYIRCARDACHEPLKQKGCHRSVDYSFLSPLDRHYFDKAVEMFHSHLLYITPALSTATQSYLFMLSCLTKV